MTFVNDTNNIISKHFEKQDHRMAYTTQNNAVNAIKKKKTI